MKTENAHIVILIKAVIRKLDVKALSGMTGTQKTDSRLRGNDGIFGFCLQECRRRMQFTF
ncbi:hypothetical protein DRA74_08185 [Neisseria meningitidis]|nr:hypothetical protein DRA74_08185 [Neisseria meningitidis]